MQLLKNLSEAKGRPWMDFTNLNNLMRCPRLYWWRSIQRIDTIDEKPALINGQAYHDCKAGYLKMIMNGTSHDLAAGAALEILDPIMARITEPDKMRNITIARNIMGNYFETHREEVYEPMEVEVHFAIDLVDFLYVGRIDAIKNWPGFGIMVEETKSTSIIGKGWQRRGKPNLQIDGYVAAVYALMGKRPYGAILDVIPVTDKPNQGDKQAFRIITIRSEKEIDSWVQNIRHWWQTKMDYEAKGFFPQNTENCTPIKGFWCDFVTLCGMCPDPHAIDEFNLPAAYHISEWAPFDELKQIEAEAR